MDFEGLYINNESPMCQATFCIDSIADVGIGCCSGSIGPAGSGFQRGCGPEEFIFVAYGHGSRPIVATCSTGRESGICACMDDASSGTAHAGGC